MNTEVNLLQKMQGVKEKRSRILSLAFLFLVLSVIVAIGMLIFLFYLKNQEGDLIRQEDAAVASLSNVQDKKIMYQTTKERLIAIQKLMQTKNILPDRYLAIADVIPNEVDLSTFQLFGKVAKITLTSSSLLFLNEFLEKNLEKLPANSDLKVKRIQIDSLGIQEAQGLYSVGVTVEFL